MDLENYWQQFLACIYLKRSNIFWKLENGGIKNLSFFRSELQAFFKAVKENDLKETEIFIQNRLKVIVEIFVENKKENEFLNLSNDFIKKCFDLKINPSKTGSTGEDKGCSMIQNQGIHHIEDSPYLNNDDCSNNVKFDCVGLIQKYIIKELNLIKIVNSLNFESPDIFLDCSIVYQLLSKVFLIKNLAKSIEKRSFISFFKKSLLLLLQESQCPLTFDSKSKIIFVVKTIVLVISSENEFNILYSYFVDLFFQSRTIPDLSNLIGLILPNITDKNTFELEILKGTDSKENMSKTKCSEASIAVTEICTGKFSHVDVYLFVSLLRGIAINGTGKRYHLVIKALIQICNTNYEPAVKLTALEAIGILLQKHKECTLSTHDQCSELLFNDIFDIIVNNWEDSIDAINGKIKTILFSLLDLSKNDKYSNFLSKIYTFLLQMNPNSRVKYAILTNILPFIDNSQIIKDFERILFYVDSPLLGHRVGELCLQIVKLNPGFKWENYIVKYFDDFKVAFDDNTMDNNVIEIASSNMNDPLFKNCSAKSKGIFDYFLNQLFLLDRNYFDKLVQKLQEYSRLESALISVLLRGKSIGIPIDPLVFVSFEKLKIFLTVSDVNTRLDTFALLICPGIKKSQSIPSTETLELFLYFLSYNSFLADSESRQKAMSYCKQFFHQISIGILMDMSFPIISAASINNSHFFLQTNPMDSGLNFSFH